MKSRIELRKMTFKLSNHAQLRCSQRNYRADDLDLILAFGTPTAEGFLMRDKDVRNASRDLNCNCLLARTANTSRKPLSEGRNSNMLDSWDRENFLYTLKRQIGALERLSGTLVILTAGVVVTVQRADREKQRRQLRRKSS
jgi:hypothetical protein